MPRVEVRSQSDVLVDAVKGDNHDPFDTAVPTFVYWIDGDAYMYEGDTDNPTVWELDEHRSPAREGDDTLLERGRKIVDEDAFDLVCIMEGYGPEDFDDQVTVLDTGGLPLGTVRVKEGNSSEVRVHFTPNTRRGRSSLWLMTKSEAKKLGEQLLNPTGKSF